jgi:hypothetical protein
MKEKPKNSKRNTIIETVNITIIGLGIVSIFPCWLVCSEWLWGPIMFGSMILTLLIDFLFTDKEAQKKYNKEMEEYYEDYEEEIMEEYDYEDEEEEDDHNDQIEWP